MALDYRKARDAAFLSVPAVMLAVPAFAESLGVGGIALPQGIDGSSAVIVLALYIIREQHVRLARLAETLASRAIEKKVEE